MRKSEVDYSVYRKQNPTKDGYFGIYGGSFLEPHLVPEFEKIRAGYQTICQSTRFQNELKRIREEFQGRPTPITHCERLSNELGGCHIYLKREDLNHTGAHKINHCMGEALLAKYLGKKKLIAETGAGQHGVALATAAAYFGMECDIYMGETDIGKQKSNVAKMKLLGARVIPVSAGYKTMKEAGDAAFEAYSAEYEDAMYCIGSAAGPHPFPVMVRDFQTVVGVEAREQFLEMTGDFPDAVVACVGGGSNAAGILIPFLNDPVELYGVEALGTGPEIGQNAASLTYGSEGIMHGFRSIILQNENGEPAPVYSIACGLDHPGVGPELAYLRDLGRVTYTVASDNEAIDAFFLLSRLEGIIPALESAHAVAFAMKLAREKETRTILVNCSGRGDKDLDFVLEKYADRLEK